MEANILVVDDEPEIADLVSVYLRGEGFTVFPCGNGADALETLRKEKIDLAVLDVMLPDISGMTLCAEIRRTKQFPILMLTARTGDTDKITGLTVGADDYITKPFSPLELVARVKAQLRRYTSYNSAEREAEETLSVDGLFIDRSSHKCIYYDEAIVLTPIEFDILWVLCSNRGRVISAKELFEMVWGEKYLDRNNTVMVHIRRIREKLEGTGGDRPRIIKTVWGVGYKID